MSTSCFSIFSIESNLQCSQLAEVDLERAAAVVDVLIVEVHARILRAHLVPQLNEHLELVVLGERDHLEDGTELGEDLLEDVQSDRVNHVEDSGAEHRVLAAQLGGLVQGGGLAQGLQGVLVVGVVGVGVELLVVGVLDEDLLAAELGGRVVEVVDHGGRVREALELEEGLVLAAQEEHVGEAAEAEAQVDDLALGELLRDVAQVDDARRLLLGLAVVQARLLGVVGCVGEALERLAARVAASL